MVGSETSPIVITLAPTMPVEAARMVKLVIVPQMRSGRMSKKFVLSTPSAMPARPKDSPVKIRLKATGKPKKRKAIIPANIRAARISFSGSISVDLVDDLLRLFPAHRPEEVLHGLGEGLDHEDQKTHDDHRLQKKAQRNATRIRRALEDPIRIAHKGDGGPDDHDGRGVEEDQIENEVGPCLLPRGPA